MPVAAQALTPTKHPSGNGPMIEATRILQQAPTPAQAQAMSAAVMALARHRAIKAVKREIRDRGLKPQYMALREIVVAADEYLPHHPELIAEAKETVLRWHAEGMFGKRGDIRTRAHRATLITDAQGAKA